MHVHECCGKAFDKVRYVERCGCRIVVVEDVVVVFVDATVVEHAAVLVALGGSGVAHTVHLDRVGVER